MVSDLPTDFVAYCIGAGSLRHARTDARRNGMETKRGRRRQRAVMATDSEWQAVRERAEAAGMDVSRFIVECATAPAPAQEDPAVVRDLGRRAARIERTVRVLYEVEKLRMHDDGAADAWQELVRRAGARVDTEEGLG